MRRNWASIRDDWLRGQRLALPRETVVAAFNKAEETFGREWVERLRVQGGTVFYGSAPTMRVVMAGARLSALEGIKVPRSLLVRLRSGDSDAWVETTAIMLLRQAQRDALVEIEPAVLVRGRLRNPDFRIKAPNDPWAYVEVCQPGDSITARRVLAALRRLKSGVELLRGSVGLEVYLRREPTSAEITTILSNIPSVALHPGRYVEQLPGDLGAFYLNYSKPGQQVNTDHGERVRPRLGSLEVRRESNGTVRHLAVRIAYTDERADEFLSAEAKQLPTTEPTLLMMHIAAPGAWREWASILRGRLRANLHTRVGGIVLFMSSTEDGGNGLKWVIRSQVIRNPHTRHQHPPWLDLALSRLALGDATVMMSAGGAFRSPAVDASEILNHEHSVTSKTFEPPRTSGLQRSVKPPRMRVVRHGRTEAVRRAVAIDKRRLAAASILVSPRLR
ncbi:MAG TPA: hypothetical protein VGR71_03690 [Nitrospira sp.]|nr:hypothetical protein [Nitrospira sp.]